MLDFKAERRLNRSGEKARFAPWRFQTAGLRSLKAQARMGYAETGCCIKKHTCARDDGYTVHEHFCWPSINFQSHRIPDLH